MLCKFNVQVVICSAYLYITFCINELFVNNLVKIHNDKIKNVWSDCFELGLNNL